MKKQIIYTFKLSDGRIGVYQKKSIAGNQVVLTCLYIMTSNYIDHMALTGNDIIINLDMITGSNVMYIDMDKLGNEPVYMYIQDKLFSSIC